MLAMSPTKAGAKTSTPTGGGAARSPRQGAAAEVKFSPWGAFREDTRSSRTSTSSNPTSGPTPSGAAAAAGSRRELAAMLSPESERMVQQFPTPAGAAGMPPKYLHGPAIPPMDIDSSGALTRGRRRTHANAAAGPGSRGKRTRSDSFANGGVQIQPVPDPQQRAHRVSAPPLHITGPRGIGTETSDFHGWDQKAPLPSCLLSNERPQAPASAVMPGSPYGAASPHAAARRAVNLGNGAAQYSSTAPTSAVGGVVHSIRPPGTPLAHHGAPGTPSLVAVGRIAGNTMPWAATYTIPQMGSRGVMKSQHPRLSPASKPVRVVVRPAAASAAAARAAKAGAAAGRAAALLGSRALPPSPPPRSKPGANGHAVTTNPCNCKKSRCLKLYCDCFAADALCDSGCRCQNCCNLDPSDPERKKAIATVLARNPAAFKPKIKAVGHTTGCHCKKSGCVKKYCECYQGAVRCKPSVCKCKNCRNTGKPGDVDHLPTAGRRKKKLKRRKASKPAQNADVMLSPLPSHMQRYPVTKARFSLRGKQLPACAALICEACAHRLFLSSLVFSLARSLSLSPSSARLH